ncbi:TPA: HNH/ENDO VII family nuclease [Vibrio parahaemolyticus]|uniref:HNH/ENDO VII family nuclease n=1 Tax=Vibrio parahaemolyticus TaxID=670 RepID=UPI0004070E54|nr:HNH/ENDO VII family nuclease [Vibrio parahaemolyticus]HCE2224692.1 HNH/ENDO VII family nuclease [Vibrio parahaemolyticus]
MDLSSLMDVSMKKSSELFNSFEQVDSNNIDINLLDNPIIKQLESRLELTPLSENDKIQLRNDKNYTDSVIEHIGSKEEAEIYSDSSLECVPINGKDALIRTDIDYSQTDDFGRTNLERMERGLAPLDKDGKSIELHHIGQNSDAPLAELTWSEHHANGNDTVLHDKQKESEIDRSAFSKERAEHWQSRAEQIKQSYVEA